jgi:AraC-like DNA-binding protein
MIAHLTVLLAGFTLFSAVSLAIAYVCFLPELRKSAASKLACLTLLSGLVFLQWNHYLYLTTDFSPLSDRLYLLTLLLVPPGFYCFSRSVLFSDTGLGLRHLLHFTPVVAGVFLPEPTIPPIAFMVGSAYCLWFIHLVLKLRVQQNRFVMERFFFGLFAVFAVAGLLLVMMIPYLDARLFYLAYANAIGVAMLLVNTAVLVFPDMLSDIQQAADVVYAKSTLSDIDVPAKKAELEQRIMDEEVYQNEKLSLSYMAGLLDLSAHQLSELVNTQYGQGFSHFVRTHRIEQAKKLLLEEPNTSVLAISIMTGFQSQSNFYAAFKEFTNQSPGEYRKNHICS